MQAEFPLNVEQWDAARVHKLDMPIHLVACARNETANINEWLCYYKQMGAQKVWLYCNDDDPEPLYKTVLPLIQGENPFLHFVHFLGEGQQKDMYKHYISNHLLRGIWVGFIDIDEFVTVRADASLSHFLSRFADFDAVHLNWVNFGPGNNIQDPPGLTIESLVRRNQNPSPHGKVFIRTDVIDVEWIVEGQGTFFHGFGDLSNNRKHRPFNSEKARIALCWGAEFYPIFEEAFSHYSFDCADKILSDCYLSHFQMRSFEHLVRRAKRKMAGDFLDQARWRDVLFANSFDHVMSADNTVEDLFLKEEKRVLVNMYQAGGDK